ncbi:putative extracellular matrix protein [Aspergillus bombycis]|uniref:Putative extracellular matrix protein n=1 Tax=Aspergillus bombycis TaxID=109264 RepID=A0A1F8AG10_9EURO|nr:putative extracellular matrix protein [Aspergillus bombycis]OGM50683.1 putative extracellular matrix protein [Aspergillus bombycis]
MRAFESIFTTVACLAHVGIIDALSFTQWPGVIHAGEDNTVKWIGDPDLPTTITLRRGAANNLSDVDVLTRDARGNEYTWKASEDLQDGSDYALKIQQNEEINYTGHITVEHPNGQAPSSKGPRPDDDPDSPDFNTAPHNSTTGVAKGNNATSTVPHVRHDDKPNTGNNHTSNKGAVSAKTQSDDASLRNWSPNLILAVVAVLYLNY